MGMWEIGKGVARAVGLRSAAGAAARWYAEVKPHQVCNRGGIKWDLDLTRTIDYGVYLGGWEPGTLKFLRKNVKTGDVVIEVGANIGAHTLPLAQMVGPSGFVHAFEPTQYALNKLHRNLSLNPSLAQRVQVYAQLVTNHEGSQPIEEIRSAWKRDGTNEQPERIAAERISIDAFVASRAIDRVSLIKIDVDGYDYKVISGAAETLRRHRPVVFIELAEYCLNEQGDSLRDIFQLFGEAGYSAYFESGEPIADVNQVLSIVGNTTSINGCFRPN